MIKLLKRLLSPFYEFDHRYGSNITGLGIIAIFVLVIVGLFAAIAVAQYVTENSECNKYSTLTGATVYYSWSTPCLVQVGEHRWVALHSLTYNNSDVTVRGAK